MGVIHGVDRGTCPPYLFVRREQAVFNSCTELNAVERSTNFQYKRAAFICLNGHISVHFISSYIASIAINKCMQGFYIIGMWKWRQNKAMQSTTNSSNGSSLRWMFLNAFRSKLLTLLLLLFQLIAPCLYSTCIVNNIIVLRQQPNKRYVTDLIILPIQRLTLQLQLVW